MAAEERQQPDENVVNPIDLFNVATGVIAYHWSGPEILLGHFALPQYAGMIAKETARKISDRYPPEGPVTPHSFEGTYAVNTHTVVDPHHPRGTAGADGGSAGDKPAEFATGELVIERMIHDHPGEPGAHFYGVYRVRWLLVLTDLGAGALGYAQGTRLQFTGIGMRLPVINERESHDVGVQDDQAATLILGWSNNIYDREWEADAKRWRAFGLRSDPMPVT